MNKERIEREISNIEIPTEELFASIHKGIEKGRKEKRRRQITSLKAFGAVSSVAASVLLASGLVFAPVSSVLAAVPFIGSFYEQHNMRIGQELEKSKLITEINQVATDKGVQATLTSAYYDGTVIGVTFKVAGEAVSEKTIKNAGPEAGYTVHVFDGVEQEQWLSSSTGLTETEDGYTTAIEFRNPNADLTETEKLPITFTSIAGVQGNWNFSVPLLQIPLETIAVEGESGTANKDYALSLKSVSKGQATTLLSYDITLPSGRENDEIRLSVFDNEGNHLSKNHAEVLKEENNKETVEKEIRELFSSKISDTADHLVIHPEIIKKEAGSKPIKMETIKVNLTN
ncbi:DUF4179 domain-containing protein [Planococcus sp. N028]|uniref:DUF4179 domain-containing protein n=1 Tax=Planococcus shixiaomingii TaxID=3058393 RepID=A0ABT8N5N5_9BACL|nr:MULTISPECIES: DUF4179 domain-containing protein [unclassified Planococcus (in: firmicutes)]MDN7243208.1 DUF4179 domain-containing protein [Planococcus sp. N028]WKA55151.1 DUF4179 domain-containing protein [Planococcus sp. N022]